MARVHCLSITSSVATIVKQCLSVPIKILKNYKIFCTLNTLIRTFLLSMITLEKIKLFPTLTELTSPGSNLLHQSCLTYCRSCILSSLVKFLSITMLLKFTLLLPDIQSLNRPALKACTQSNTNLPYIGIKYTFFKIILK